MWAEFERLHEFYWTADAQGLVIPEDGQLLRTPEGWRRLRQNLARHPWPPDNLLSMLALAQHSGVATRLLDWSDRPLVAAYFAASGAAADAAGHNPCGQPMRLSVWALDLDWIVYEAWPSRPGRAMRVYVVTAPRATNSNLHAQGGLFTTDPLQIRDLSQPVRAEPVNALVKRRSVSPGPDVMVHLTLEARHAGTLLRLLHSEGVSAASVFPGFSGVAQALRERSFWDRGERTSYWFT